MNHKRTWARLLCLIVSGCGGGEPAETSLETSAQSIVRGDETDAIPQALFLHTRSATGVVHCTASYIAPRVVLTAAHCVRPNSFSGVSYVYFGMEHAPAFGDEPEIPSPGEPSDFARVESFRVHPDYDPGLNYPDVAIAYLDRELPFEPLPLFTEKVGGRFVGEQATIVGWGGSRALVADISQVEGAGLERKGHVTLLGSPTEADFHADDPNPGMLEPAIRADSLKSDGGAPRSNGCAGDSGGPLLIRKNGRNFVAGVAYWTGLFCEDYSIYTRIDAVLDFIQESVRDAGRGLLQPRLECVDHAPDGTYTAFFGYENHNGITLDIPHSARNALLGDEAGVRPESFAPGEHPWLFSVEFTKREHLLYRLAPPGGRGGIVSADRHSPLCTCGAACDAQLAAECFDGGFARSDCLAGCQELGQFFPIACQASLDVYNQCVAALPPAAENWVCDPTFIPQPVACQDEFFAALGCAGFL